MILVVLLVLLVPELLTGPRAVPSPTPVQPDQAPMRSYTMDLGESPHANARAGGAIDRRTAGARTAAAREQCAGGRTRGRAGGGSCHGECP